MSRVIVAEDSFVIAEGLKLTLQNAGYEVVGTAGNLAAALDLVAGVPFDVAVLDIDLRGHHVAPVAEAVRARGKPVVFVSGYGEAELLPPYLRSLPRLEKPVDSADLLAAVVCVLAARCIE